MKLFTIGDSISQGFMSLAAARTDLSYSTLLARKLGLQPELDYRYADWDYGIPLDVEAIMRRLNQRYGSDISGLEWLTVLQTVNDVIDFSEDFYERGAGRADIPYGNGKIEYFDNVAVWGFEIADAWQITPKFCRDEIDQNTGPIFNDNYLTGPDSPMYRTAIKVLNPSLNPKYDDFSQIDWLEKHAKRAGGIENTILWLGANNALGTVTTLKINQTPNDPDRRPASYSAVERLNIRKWNLWHPDDFAADYGLLLDKVDAIMNANKAQNWNVFIGTIPLVTIAPLAKGVGDPTEIDGKGIYFKYYTYFPFDEEFAVTTGIHLTMQDALHIDDCIREYNVTIKDRVEKLNNSHGRSCYHVVDISDALQQMAYKRNNGQPTYDFPQFFDFIYPMVNTKYYHADTEGRLKQGGLFTLDGVHPSAIGQGLVAWEFLKVMNGAGITDVAGKAVADNFGEDEWKVIFSNDLLYSKPISLMQEIYKKGDLAKHIVSFIKRFKN
jgi:hypothetical protein